MTERYYPPTVTPPDQPLGFLKGLWVLSRNPMEWWPRQLYEGRDLKRQTGRFVQLSTTNPDLAREILLDKEDSFHRSFILKASLGPALRESLLLTDGESWRNQRRLAAPAFRRQELDALVPAFSRAAERAVGRLTREPGTHEVMEELIHATLDVVFEAILGLSPEDDRVTSIADDVTVYLTSLGRIDPLDLLRVPDWVPRPWKRRGVAAAERLRAETRRIIAEKRAMSTPGTDLLSRLIAATDEDGGVLTDERLVDNIMTFIAAGHETTALTLTWTLSILAHMPQLQDRLAAEAFAVAGDAPIDASHLPGLDLTTRVIQESLRLYPPVAGLMRSVAEPVRIGEHELKPGDHVAVPIFPMQRCAALWPDPARFDPDRFLPENSAGRHRFAYLPFGAGPRICIGMGFALMEAAAMLATLMRQLTVAPDPSYRFAPQIRITMRPSQGMQLRIARRA